MAPVGRGAVRQSTDVQQLRNNPLVLALDETPDHVVRQDAQVGLRRTQVVLGHDVDEVQVA